MSELISVIVPCYNIEKLIDRTVESILRQNHRNLEIILVDDGSKDGTLEVLRQLEKSDNRIKVIHKENGGVTRARLTGVSVASGNWISFVDGDDFIEPDMYERLLNNAHKYFAQISHCGYQMVFPSRVDYYYNTGRLVQQDKLTGMKDLLDGSFIEPGLCNKLFHKTLFHSLLHDDVMDLSIKNTEDLLMNFYLFREANRSVYEDFCPYHYMVRINSAATGKLSENKLLDPIRVTEILLSETSNVKELQRILKEKYIRQLIRIASHEAKSNPELIVPNRHKAVEKLRELLPEILTANYSIKLKGMALITGVCPWAYQLIHGFYKKVTGLDKKYEVS